MEGDRQTSPPTRHLGGFERAVPFHAAEQGSGGELRSRSGIVALKGGVLREPVHDALFLRRWAKSAPTARDLVHFCEDPQEKVKAALAQSSQVRLF